MQTTRQHILMILREEGEATVQDVVRALRELRNDSITAVTVRHHLSVLQDEGLVDSPETQYEPRPGRPRYIYRLTPRGLAYFPNNYQKLAAGLFSQIQSQFSSEQVNVILDGVANTMANDAIIPPGTLIERLDATIAYLNECGYRATWEKSEGGYILHMSNCPYHGLVDENEQLCGMDARLLTALIGKIPRIVSKMTDNDDTCSYFIADK